MIVKTNKGTELPILDLKGKNYLEVKWRIVWFREEKPEWSIETEFPALTNDSAVAKATIKDEKGRIIATGHKREDKSHFPDFSEKAESGAIGRALALIGYGTQFASELEEGDRLADSPVAPKGKAPLKVVETPTETKLEYDPGKYVVKFGKKFKGMKLEDCDIYELNSFHAWLKEQSAGPKGLSDDAHQAYVNIGQFLDMRERPAHLQEGK